MSSLSFISFADLSEFLYIAVGSCIAILAYGIGIENKIFEISNRVLLHLPAFRGRLKFNLISWIFQGIRPSRSFALPVVDQTNKSFTFMNVLTSFFLLPYKLIDLICAYSLDNLFRSGYIQFLTRAACITFFNYFIFNKVVKRIEKYGPSFSPLAAVQLLSATDPSFKGKGILARLLIFTRGVVIYFLQTYRLSFISIALWLIHFGNITYTTQYNNQILNSICHFPVNGNFYFDNSEWLCTRVLLSMALLINSLAYIMYFLSKLCLIFSFKLTTKNADYKLTQISNFYYNLQDFEWSSLENNLPIVVGIGYLLISFAYQVFIRRPIALYYNDVNTHTHFYPQFFSIPIFCHLMRDTLANIRAIIENIRKYRYLRYKH